MPRPERTLGIVPWRTYIRCPGRERRRRPVIALVRGSAQRRRTTISGHAVVVVAHVVAGDVALVLEDDAQPLLQLGGRREHLRLARQDGVANASEEIRDWISH